MKIEIDQSGKIEFTSQQTVIADSGRVTTCIYAKEKRYLKKHFRTLGKTSQFTITAFSALVALHVNFSDISNGTYVIDSEYLGHENKIIGLIKTYCKKLGKDTRSISFQVKPVGKKSLSHLYAIETFRDMKRCTRCVTALDIIDLVRLKPIKKT
jgi:hypothetical protein